MAPLINPEPKPSKQVEGVQARKQTARALNPESPGLGAALWRALRVLLLSSHEPSSISQLEGFVVYGGIRVLRPRESPKPHLEVHGYLI